MWQNVGTWRIEWTPGGWDMWPSPLSDDILATQRAEAMA